MKVQKRNGDVVEFDVARIERAVTKAFESVYTKDIMEEKKGLVESITSNLFGRLEKRGSDVPAAVETIQDIIEAELMRETEFTVAKRYILYRETHKKLRNKRKAMPPEAIQDYIFTSRYARYLKDKKRRETYAETIGRVHEMHLAKFPHAAEEINWAFERVLEKRVLPSMRSLQFGGKAIEQKNERIYNCSFSVCDRVDFFKETLFLLLCGVGVGFSVEFEHVDKLPALAFQIDETDVTHFTIDDSIEGWSGALEKLLDSYIKGYLVEFNYSLIRPKGELLKTSGGKAPGHVPLRKAIEKIRHVLDGALGRKMKPIEVYDIVMHACDAVLAGGVRRSATICLFSIDDGEMMSAKTGNWFNENPQRARSNNSVKLVRDEVSKAQFLRIFERQKQWGEPGFYFAENVNYGSNPCVEIGLNPFLPMENGEQKSGWAFCNLTEINGSAILTEADFRTAVKAATIIGTLQAAYTDFPFLGETTEGICRREALLGVSITGMMDSPDVIFDADMQRRMAEYAIEVNTEMAELLKIEPAARITCVKPAGTTSLVLGTASGIHPRHAKKYFRRVQANTDDPVYRHFNFQNKECCEPSHWSANKTDDVITFCIEAPEKAITREEVGAIDLLEKVLMTQQNWVKAGTARPESSPGLLHNVSNTISVKDDEWEDVSEFIWSNRESFTGVAMLSHAGDKAYVQAPHEAVVTEEDEALWETYCANYNPVDYTMLHEEEDVTVLKEVVACGGGACELV